MSIYIKGMKLPTDEPRRLVIYPDGRIYDAAGFFQIDATAEQLPPHGRLGDLDALIANHFSDEHRIAMSYADKCWMRRIINGEQTIIPAEEE